MRFIENSPIQWIGLRSGAAIYARCESSPALLPPGVPTARASKRMADAVGLAPDELKSFGSRTPWLTAKRNPRPVTSLHRTHAQFARNDFRVRHLLIPPTTITKQITNIRAAGSGTREDPTPD